MINIKYVACEPRARPVRVYMRKRGGFSMFYNKQNFQRCPYRALHPEGETHSHGHLPVFFSVFINKLALHDTKLLPKNSQWGGKSGGGIYVYMNRNLHASRPKVQADYY